MLLLALALATMPQPIGRAIPSDLTALSLFSGETRPVDFRIRLHIDPTGQPVFCDAENPDERDRVVVARICHYLFAKARFTPARDPAGTAIAAIVRIDLSMNHAATLRAATDTATATRAPGKLDYALAVTSVPGGASMAVANLQLITDAGGRVTLCEVAGSSGSAALDRIACREMQNTTFTPGMDREQHHVAAVRAITVGFASGPIAQ